MWFAVLPGLMGAAFVHTAPRQSTAEAANVGTPFRVSLPDASMAIRLIPDGRHLHVRANEPSRSDLPSILPLRSRGVRDRHEFLDSQAVPSRHYRSVWGIKS